MLTAVLEDDADQRDLIMLWLEHGGHRAQGFATGAAFTEALKNDKYQLLVIDWMLPDTTGDAMIQWVRDNLGWNVPVIVLTARDDEQTVLTALRAGADDYLVKPARSAEMLARIAAVARRYGLGGKAPLTLGAYEIDIQRVRISVNGTAIDLTQKEFDLAVYMFQSPGQLLSRDHLLNRVWGVHADVDTRTVDTHVSRLRKKLHLDGTNGWKVIPIYGYGYRCVRLDAPE
ncbi:response regulator transcription factor [Burkholderia sp. Ac-20379]|uniref:response regulator transcription factor n=1 Tax=Burkholderia sp. Ac-20379 TaxID=2703900 RepID=UPI001981284F|nr:response regulator transcription factor [Burkholderia sp. Ac-20379]MBN3726961.1 response regulator transcription factor [Burkholderia sp. Ac-20379]